MIDPEKLKIDKQQLELDIARQIHAFEQRYGIITVKEVHVLQVQAMFRINNNPVGIELKIELK